MYDLHCSRTKFPKTLTLHLPIHDGCILLTTRKVMNKEGGFIYYLNLNGDIGTFSDFIMETKNFLIVKYCVYKCLLLRLAVFLTNHWIFPRSIL